MTSRKRLAGLLLVGSVLLWGAVQAAPPSDSGVTPAQVLASLQAGNARFVAGHAEAADHLARRQDLVAGQAPGAIVLSCSDSRVPPEIVFDQGLGEIFVIRVAGDVIDPAVMASIEYAVAHLGSKLLLVLGHSYCGAVKAALTTPAGQSAGSPDLDQLVGSIQQNLKGKPYPSSKEDPSLSAAVQAQTQAVARQVFTRSPIVHVAVMKGSLQIVSGVYDLKTGRVEFDTGRAAN